MRWRCGWRQGAPLQPSRISFDPHGGRADLSERRLRLLHGGSVRVDPTRQMLMALIVAADDPHALARRLQLPHHQQKLLAGLNELRRRLQQARVAEGPLSWSLRLDAHGLPAGTVALALAAGEGARRPLLRW